MMTEERQGPTTKAAPVFRYRCRCCGMVFSTIGRLGDDALTMLAEHVRQGHPRAALGADPQAGAVLEHFDLVSA